MAKARRRTLTEADKRAAAKVRELWADFQKKHPGISQDAAAARAGMGQSAFSQFLRGTVPMRVAPVLKFAKLFGVSATVIRDDLNELAYSAARTPQAQPISRYESTPLSEEAIEIARAFEQLQPQTKERIREHVFMYAVIDKSFPWLRTGRPVSSRYDAFEKWHVENRQAQLALEAARITKKTREK